VAPEVTAFGCEEIAQSAGQRLHSTIPRPGATAARVKRLAASGDPEVFATLRVATELVPGGQAVKARWIHGLATGPRGSLDHTGSVGGSSGRTCGSRDPAGEQLQPPVLAKSGYDPEEPPTAIAPRPFRNKSRIGANIFGDSGVYSGMQGEAMAQVSGLAEAARGTETTEVTMFAVWTSHPCKRSGAGRLAGQPANSLPVHPLRL
jgi:hypothetical protein